MRLKGCAGLRLKWAAALKERELIGAHATAFDACRMCGYVPITSVWLHLWGRLGKPFMACAKQSLFEGPDCWCKAQKVELLTNRVLVHTHRNQLLDLVQVIRDVAGKRLIWAAWLHFGGSKCDESVASNFGTELSGATYTMCHFS